MKHNKESALTIQQTPLPLSEDKSRDKRIHLTLVTEEEREKYRVPSYDYIL